MAFAERWHPETSSFHLSHSEITITLDDVACLLHLPISGTLIGHGRLTKKEAMEMLIEELDVDLHDALEEVERIRGAHVRFSFLHWRYDVELLTTHETAGDPVEVEIHKERVLRCYFLYLLGTQLFVDTSSSYIDVVYLRYLSDITRVHKLGSGYTSIQLS
ncbi:protein MAIN-LIKE 1-like [Vicia villosa]|uniref:protein MAIN-LIKE 1-like n=1 Tax=Vicia villosa TaxID=3911 RepID=UPI00273CCB17|nr:protein MAIN-LIKE 1-like [Vicia villosa]